MVTESLAIVVVILVMAVMYRRAGKRQLALLALPLISVPLSRLVSAAVLGNPGVNPSRRLMEFAFVLAGLIAAVTFCTLLSRRLTNRKVRYGYLIVSFVFSGALTLAYLL